MVFIPFHFAEAAANVLTDNRIDERAKIPDYKVCAVRVDAGGVSARPSRRGDAADRSWRDQGSPWIGRRTAIELPMTRHRIYPADHLAAASRTDLLAWLAAERSDLLMQLVDLDERTLSQQAVTGGWTVKDLLAHVAYWDAFFARSVEMALAGRAGKVADVNLDERNAAIRS